MKEDNPVPNNIKEDNYLCRADYPLWFNSQFSLLVFIVTLPIQH